MAGLRYNAMMEHAASFPSLTNLNARNWVEFLSLCGNFPVMAHISMFNEAIIFSVFRSKESFEKWKFVIL